MTAKKSIKNEIERVLGLFATEIEIKESPSK